MFYLLFKGDSLIYHLGQQFSTRDQDNDLAAGDSCAELAKGGWWYGNCHHSNLNGRYYRSGNYTSTSTDPDGVEWNDWKGRYYSLTFTEMKFRLF